MKVRCYGSRKKNKSWRSIYIHVGLLGFENKATDGRLGLDPVRMSDLASGRISPSLFPFHLCPVPPGSAIAPIAMYKGLGKRKRRGKAVMPPHTKSDIEWPEHLFGVSDHSDVKLFEALTFLLELGHYACDSALVARMKAEKGDYTN